MQKLLITGAGGFLGHALCEQAAGNWDVHAVYRQHKPATAGVTAVQADLTEPGCIDSLIDSVRPCFVIHAAAMADVGFCQAHPRQAEAINTAVPARLAERCAQQGMGFVLTSTDLVFDGHSAPYCETDTVHALSIYGRQKVRAEQLVQQAHPGALVCRLPLMIGLAPHAGHHFCIRMLHSIRSGAPLSLFTDEFRTPVDNTSAAAGILGAMERTRGVLHLGGKTRVSRYDLGVMMCAAFGIAPDMLRPVSIASLDTGTPRAADVSLDSRKAYGLGYAPVPLDRAVDHIVKRFSVIPAS